MKQIVIATFLAGLFISCKSVDKKGNASSEQDTRIQDSIRYAEKQLAPGEEGVTKAKFDSKGRPCENRKHISVDANTNPSRSHSLDFRVEVTN